MRKLRRIIKLGNIYTITIPIELVKEMGLKKGDYVEVKRSSPTEILFRKVDIVQLKLQDQERKQQRRWIKIKTPTSGGSWGSGRTSKTKKGAKLCNTNIRKISAKVKYLKNRGSPY
jgi:bifunctional DNA-binding transcriptional regulator/antitoxin component of YhaV-PrlF toxin-antitoxin module